jgi:hypothetical protein
MRRQEEWPLESMLMLGRYTRVGAVLIFVWINMLAAKGESCKYSER